MVVPQSHNQVIFIKHATIFVLKKMLYIILLVLSTLIIGYMLLVLCWSKSDDNRNTSIESFIDEGGNIMYNYIYNYIYCPSRY